MQYEQEEDARTGAPTEDVELGSLQDKADRSSGCASGQLDSCPERFGIGPAMCLSSARKKTMSRCVFRVERQTSRGAGAAQGNECCPIISRIKISGQYG
jgi:hypothetical protein